MGLAGTTNSHAEPARGPVLRLSGLARSSSLLRVTEIEPQSVATPGALVEGSVPLGASRWSAVAGASVGGSWFTFNGPGIDGRFSYVEWSARAGAERELLWGERGRLDAQVFFEYGEVHSWLENLVTERSGPHTYRAGGGVRVTATGPRRGWLRPVLGLEHSVHRAHASDERTGNQYAWIGGASALSLGLQIGRSP